MNRRLWSPRFWSPRYWPTWLLLAWMQFAALLPFRWNVRLHKRIGRLAGTVLKSSGRIARRNLELCFPELGPDEIAALLRRHFEAMGAFVGETAVAWFGSARGLRALLEVDGLEHLHTALASGRGVLLFTGHFTGLEITGPALGALTDRFAFMYSRRRNALIDEIQAHRRNRIARESFPRDNVRAMLRSLRNGAVVWYAADQYYGGSHASLVRFFHEPAMTNTAISRLARLSGAVVMPFYYRRRDDDSGYELTFHPPLEDFPSEDAVEDTRRLVAFLEDAIRKSPEQYLWNHKRFRDRPPPLPDLYARPSAAAASR